MESCIQLQPESRSILELTWLQNKLSDMPCHASIPAADAREAGYNMWHMYVRYWKPFGELLTDMEKEGMLVNRCALPGTACAKHLYRLIAMVPTLVTPAITSALCAAVLTWQCFRALLLRREHLAAAQKRAMADQEEAVTRFKAWASRYVRGAEHMNVCSGAQVRQLLFAGAPNSKFPDDADKRMELTRAFKVRQPSTATPLFAVYGRSIVGEGRGLLGGGGGGGVR